MPETVTLENIVVCAVIVFILVSATTQYEQFASETIFNFWLLLARSVDHQGTTEPVHHARTCVNHRDATTKRAAGTDGNDVMSGKVGFPVNRVFDVGLIRHVPELALEGCGLAGIDVTDGI